jgi:hypothetical protein
MATWEKTDSLPDEVISSMNNDLPDFLRPIWQMLDGTGCRLAEITGLRVEDLHMDGVVPFFRLRFHDVRRLKTWPRSGRYRSSETPSQPPRRPSPSCPRCHLPVPSICPPAWP